LDVVTKFSQEISQNLWKR